MITQKSSSLPEVLKRREIQEFSKSQERKYNQLHFYIFQIFSSDEIKPSNENPNNKKKRNGGKKQRDRKPRSVSRSYSSDRRPYYYEDNYYYQDRLPPRNLSHQRRKAEYERFHLEAAREYYQR